MRGVLRTLVALAAVLAVAETIRRTLAGMEHASRDGDPPGETAAAGPPAAQLGAPPTPKRETLYEEAQTLKIKGRSSMSREELAEAIPRAREERDT